MSINEGPISVKKKKLFQLKSDICNGLNLYSEWI